MMRNSAILLATAALIVVPAHAQDAVGPAAAGPVAQAEDDYSALGEIVVTANKRTENLSKVGASVTALSGAVLQERQIVSLQDLAAVVPGLQFSSTISNTPVFTLRGIGFNENSLGVYPAVSVYVDQSPLPFPVMTGHSAYDLERVEVLKGPQGTLFGQNSTGGAVNYIAAKPTAELSYGGDISYGRFNQLSGNAFISGPVTENLGVRVAVNGLRMDPWQRSVTRNDKNGRQKYFAGRFLADWKASDTVRFLLNLNGWVDKSEPQALQLVGKRPVDPIGQPPKPNYVAAPLVSGNARDADWTATFFDPADGQTKDFSPRQNRRFFQASLRADIDMSDDITLTSLSTFNKFRQTQTTDADGMVPVSFNNRNNGTARSIIQELRLANAASNRFRWIIGANYENSKTFEFYDNRYIDDAASNPNNLNINGTDDHNRQRITNYAGFANAEYDLTDQLKAIAGVRYTNSKIRDYNCGFAQPGYNIDTLFNFLGGLLGQVPFTPIGTGPGQCFALNRDLVPGQPYEATLHEENVSWRAGLNYQVNPLTMVYASASRGYKSGSFPTLAASSYGSLLPVTQERVTAFEIGAKTRTSDGKVSLSTAAFYYNYADKQVKGKILDVPNIFGPIGALVNIPKSRIWGLEAELTVRPVRGLTINANGTYLNSKIQRYAGFDVNGAQRDFSGVPLPFTPKWSGSIDFDYRFETANGRPFIGLTVMGRTSIETEIGARGISFPTNVPFVQLAPGVTQPFVIPGYVVADGRVGYESNQGWKAYLWGKNIFNRYYTTTAISGSDTVARAAGMPATYGVTLAFRLP